MAGAAPITRREMLGFLIAGGMAAFSAGYPQLGFAADDGNFRAIYLDPRLRGQFFLFLRNVFHLYPEEDFHELIEKMARRGMTDREIYELILAELPEIKRRVKIMESVVHLACSGRAPRGWGNAVGCGLTDSPSRRRQVR
jgi:hypothetical protein